MAPHKVSRTFDVPPIGPAHYLITRMRDRLCARMGLFHRADYEFLQTITTETKTHGIYYTSQYIRCCIFLNCRNFSTHNKLVFHHTWCIQMHVYIMSPTVH